MARMNRSEMSEKRLSPLSAIPYIAAMRATPVTPPLPAEPQPAPARTFAIAGHLLTAPKAAPGLHLEIGRAHV